METRLGLRGLGLGVGLALLCSSAFADQQKLPGSQTVKTVLVSESDFGGCMVELEGGDPQDTFSNCRSRWVTLSCDGTWLPKTISSSLLEQAQIAYALKRTIRVVVDNERGHNGYCLATRIDLR